MPGTRQLRANIDDVGAVGDQLLCLRERAIRRVETSAVGKKSGVTLRMPMIVLRERAAARNASRFSANRVR